MGRERHFDLTEEEFPEQLWRNRDALEADGADQLVAQAIAAYGELLRRKNPAAVWVKFGVEPAIVLPGRPWTRRRVEREIQEALDIDL